MSLIKLQFHFVLGTKARAPLITPEVELALYPIITGLVKELGGALIAIGGVHNHVHLACALPSSTSIAAFMRQLKSISSLRLNRSTPMPMPFRWQNGYFGMSVAPGSVPHLTRYIKNQKQHHDKGTCNPDWEDPR